jgi:hypothetical protein
MHSNEQDVLIVAARQHCHALFTRAGECVHTQRKTGPSKQQGMT